MMKTTTMTAIFRSASVVPPSQPDVAVIRQTGPSGRRSPPANPRRPSSAALSNRSARRPATRDPRSAGPGSSGSPAHARLRGRRDGSCGTPHRRRRGRAEADCRRGVGAGHVQAPSRESGDRGLRDRHRGGLVKFGIVTFPGSNCDYDAFHAVADEFGEEAVYLWHKSHDLAGVDVVVLPGGFSYGDYLRAGAIARFSPIMNEVIAHAGRGGPVLAVCNGFQIACEAGLLPGALLRNDSLRFQSDWVRLRVETTATMFTERYDKGAILRIPIAHGEGRFTADAATLDRLEGEGQIVLRYVDAS